MVVCHHPFGEPEEGEDIDEGIDDFDEEVGDYDATDSGDMDEFYEDEDNVDKSLRKSIENTIRKSKEAGIEPKRQYLKALTEDQFDKIIGKDAYSFLHGHEDEVIMTLTVGKEVSDSLKTLQPEDMLDVYWIIIEDVQKVGWSRRKMVERLMDRFPQLEEYEAERIIRTELSRVLYYAKEMIAEREDLGEYNYAWVGPLDYRTTPMCYYLQTGELRESDIIALEKAGHTKADLPEIPEEGMPLEQLKETCRIVAECFGQKMVSDWVMHINCRHTFARGNKRLDVEISDPSEIEQIIQTFPTGIPQTTIGQMPPSVTLEPPLPEPEVTDDYVYIPIEENSELDSFIFINSIKGRPTMYDNLNVETIYTFEEMNERDLASWARMVVQLKAENLSEEVIIWAITDTALDIEDMLAGYIVVNAEAIVERAEEQGWFW